jgi:hypothetical protein
VPNTVRSTRLSMGSGNRTHSRSVFRNGQRGSQSKASALGRSPGLYSRPTQPS